MRVSVFGEWFDACTRCGGPLLAACTSFIDTVGRKVVECSTCAQKDAEVAYKRELDREIIRAQRSGRRNS